MPASPAVSPPPTQPDADVWKGAPGAIYCGKVMHARLKPVIHRFSYDLFMLALDVDRVDEVAEACAWFGHNGGWLYSFHDKDHGPRSREPLRPWVEDLLAAAGVSLDGGSIRLLCFPRVFGYVFNPLAVYFCYGPDGDLRGVVHQVSNTFGQSHAYVIPAQDGPGPIRQGADKVFHVSPFIAMDCTYGFSLVPPGERVSVSIRQCDPEGPLLIARMKGDYQPLTQDNLKRLFWRYPLMSFKVIGAIHYEALHLWRKGAGLKPEPPLPEGGFTIGRAGKTHADFP